MQRVGARVAQGDGEHRRVNHTPRLGVDQFEQRVEINGKVQGAADLAEHILHADAPFQVVHGLRPLDGQGHLVAQTLDEAQVFVAVGRAAPARADGENGIQPFLPAQAHDDRRAQHSQARPAAHHFQRQRASFFQVQQAGLRAQVAHQPALRAEDHIGEALARRRVRARAIVARRRVAHEQNSVGRSYSRFQRLHQQPRHLIQADGIRHLARELLQQRLVGAAGTVVHRVNASLQALAQRVEGQRHTEDRQHNQRRADGQIAHRAAHQRGHARHQHEVAQGEQSQQRRVESGARRKAVGVQLPPLGNSEQGTERQQCGESLGEHGQRRHARPGDDQRDQPRRKREQRQERAKDQDRALAAHRQRRRPPPPPEHPRQQDHAAEHVRPQGQAQPQAACLCVVRAIERGARCAGGQRCHCRRYAQRGHLLDGDEAVGHLQRQHDQQPAAQRQRHDPGPGGGLCCQRGELSGDKHGKRRRHQRHNLHERVGRPASEEQRRQPPQDRARDPARGEVGREVASGKVGQHHAQGAGMHAAGTFRASALRPGGHRPARALKAHGHGVAGGALDQQVVERIQPLGNGHRFQVCAVQRGEAVALAQPGVQRGPCRAHQRFRRAYRQVALHERAQEGTIQPGSRRDRVHKEQQAGDQQPDGSERRCQPANGWPGS